MENCDTVQATPLKTEHVKLGARMVPFAGWEMPVQYAEGILAEHKHCRTQASLFDICHMGEFRIKGERAAADLDRIFARSVLDQPIYVARYSFLLNEAGCVQDDLLVYRLAEDEFYIVVNAGPRASDAAWIKARLSEGVSFTDESEQTAKLDLQGPKSAEVLGRLGVALEQLPGYYKCTFVTIGGVKMMLSRTGYTGELGFELYFDASKALDIWNLILKDPVVKPCGLGARDTLRLEVGYPLYGHEMDLNTTPIEAGFGPMLKLATRTPFVGSGVLCDSEKSKPKRQLIGLVLDSKRAAREGAEIVYKGEVIGKVTSGVYAPSLDRAIAMGYIDSSIELPLQTEVNLRVGRTELPAKVSASPFYSEGTVRQKLV